jgi:DNA-binding CsgD family transcriptional regulator
MGKSTDSELRVVRAVARGATNRDAAEQLFLSPHTVSTHLRHTFSKLDINSRNELILVVLAQDGGSVALAEPLRLQTENRSGSRFSPGHTASRPTHGADPQRRADCSFPCQGAARHRADVATASRSERARRVQRQDARNGRAARVLLGSRVALAFDARAEAAERFAGRSVVPSY